jgi:hypothetical protein
VRRLAAVIVWTVLAVGVAGGMLSLHSRGGVELLRAEQSGALGLRSTATPTAAGVEAVVASAPEPVAPAKRTKPAQVRCRPGTGGTLRNPWSCTIRYRSGTRAHYRVVVEPNGYYSGTGTGIIEGCCVVAPTFN